VLRLYLDADIDPLVARQLQTRGYDIVGAHDAGMARASDLEHLVYATHEGRALLTFNIDHFSELYDQWWHEQRTHFGIILSRQYQRAEIGELLRLVKNVLQLATQDDLANRLRFLGEFDV
jgi:predicted nuclease of predicted toxin-antitoxin system